MEELAAPSQRKPKLLSCNRLARRTGQRSGFRRNSMLQDVMKYYKNGVRAGHGSPIFHGTGLTAKGEFPSHQPLFPVRSIMAHTRAPPTVHAALKSAIAPGTYRAMVSRSTSDDGVSIMPRGIQVRGDLRTRPDGKAGAEAAGSAKLLRRAELIIRGRWGGGPVM